MRVTGHYKRVAKRSLKMIAQSRGMAGNHRTACYPETCQKYAVMVAIRGKADMPFGTAHVCF